jgi:hypothetical protein
VPHRRRPDGTFVHWPGGRATTPFPLTEAFKLGLRMLGAMWITLDLIWGGALLVTGAVALRA